MSMAALGLLMAFFMVLIAVLLAPTLASANRDTGGPHSHGGTPGAGNPHGGPGGASHGFAENWNQPGHDHDNASGAPFCVDGGVYPCANSGTAGDGFDGDRDGFGGDFAPGGNSHGEGGDGSPNGNGQYAPNFWTGGGGAGGGSGEGGGPGGNKAGTNEPGNPDPEQDDENTKPGEPEIPLLTLTLPDDELPSDFVDPNFDDGDPKSEGDPQDGGEHPPVTELTTTEVPEPLTLSLFAVGLVGAARLRQRSRRSA
ncbi:MAG: PEP-CTERM sorting domain-containing protein [Rhizomicrobium sp.]